MPRPSYESVDDYLAAQPEPTRRALERVRATIRKALPTATERISYQIPVYEIGGVMVLYFAGFRSHYSIYPATPRIVAALEQDLEGRLHSKATIRFPLTEAVPIRLISRIAKLRASEVAGRQSTKAARKPGAPKTKTPRSKPAARSSGPR